jgi:NAD-dependent SIR2 family protein deacetylase
MKDEIIIPSKLKNAHQDGNVVFFCGAGISVPAGYPSFKKLTESILDKNPVIDDAVIQRAIKEHRYDDVLAILEHTTNRKRPLRNGVISLER